MNAPVLLSVKAAGKQVTFTWEPYIVDQTGIHGSVQGFDNNGEHVIGAFVFRDQLAAGTITVPLERVKGKTTVQCELDVGGYLDDGTYEYAKSNVIALSL